MRARHLFVVTAMFLGCSARALAAQGFHWDSIVLYQPNEDLRARLSSAEALAAYMKRIDAVSTSFFASDTTPERLDIVVGVKPGRKSRVWFASSRRSSQDNQLIALRKRLEAIPPCIVHGGPIAFALRCSIAGATSPKELPAPKEWRPKGKEPLLVPDGVFARIWRD
jgi:hypothetical protein